MNNHIYWQVTGSGEDIVFLHGWGMNGAVWEHVAKVLSCHYRVHLVDLPGYGLSSKCIALSMDDIVAQLLLRAPKNAIWVGWSLGGLIASHVARYFPEFVCGLVTVASSPKFAADSHWRGISSKVLSDFTTQLIQDFQQTIDRFMALQAMGSQTARQDLKQLKMSILSKPAPNPEVLLSGLTMLKEIDQRDELMDLSLPMLRMYGRLDGLVPMKVAQELDKLWIKTESLLFSQSSHAPFITEFDVFCDALRKFIQKLHD